MYLQSAHLTHQHGEQVTLLTRQAEPGPRQKSQENGRPGVLSQRGFAVSVSTFSIQFSNVCTKATIQNPKRRASVRTHHLRFLERGPGFVNRCKASGGAAVRHAFHLTRLGRPRRSRRGARLEPHRPPATRGRGGNVAPPRGCGDRTRL